MNIAIIPARSKSKRIKNKNIKLFFGKPIIFYSIDLALKSKIFDKVLVSTDSKKIKKIAEKYGAEVPFIRPKNLSNDFVGTPAVVKHAIHWCQKKKLNIKNICCIYPTAPLLEKKYLIEGYKKIKNSNYDFVFSACKHEKTVQRSFYLDKKNNTKMFFSSFYSKRSQDLKDAYFDAGSFYWGTKKSWLQKKPMIFSKNSSIIKLPNNKVQDLDTNLDWKKLSIKFKKTKDI